MTAAPLLAAPPLIQLHLAAALLALVAGALALFLARRRHRGHRVAGAVAAAAMLATALSSFGIREGGSWSWIHILSVLTLVGLTQGLGAILRGRRVAHGKVMRALYAQALILAGVFTLLPGRRLNDALFADAPWTGFAVTAALGALAMVAVLWPGAIPSFLRRRLRLSSPRR